jgi:hypothetical protein
MAYTLGQLLFDTLSALGQMTTYKASGGSTTTAIRTNTGYTQTNLTGTLIVRETTDGLAPQHEFSEVTAFAPSTGTFTVGDAFTAGIGSGDIFGFASPLFPTRQIIESINEGLRSLGDLHLVDTTTLDTADNKTEYAASVLWKRRPPYRIDVQTNTSDADGNDNRWWTIRDWEYIPAAPGSTGLLVMPQFASGYDLRIWYQDNHPRVTDYDDVIAEVIPPELAVAVCAEKALLWQKNRTQSSEPGILKAWQDSRVAKEEAMNMYKVWRPERKQKALRILGKRFWYYDEGSPNKVRL